VYRRLFVARVHYANAFAQAAVVNSGDMTTAEGEDDFNPFSFENFGDQPAAMYHAQGGAPFYAVNQVFSLLDLLYVIYACMGADKLVSGGSYL